jgi:ADP-ribose pyrophosphatase YjhB (NUDIX family)
MPTIGVFAAIFDERRRIICVKRNYGPRNWGLPGGGMEPHESLLVALEREVREETGYLVRAGRLIGVYALPPRDDVVLFFEATVVGREPWQPNGEIVEVAFFPEDELPEPMGSRAKVRIQDAFAGLTGVVRVFDAE